MLNIPDEEHAYLKEMRHLETDASGNEVMVGLTVDESIEYFKHLQGALDRLPTVPGAVARFLALAEKHESKRRAILIAETEARLDDSARH